MAVAPHAPRPHGRDARQLLPLLETALASESLQEISFCGQMMGDSAALKIAEHLQEGRGGAAKRLLRMDGNNFTTDGFRCLSCSIVNFNSSLLHWQYPSSDIER